MSSWVKRFFSRSAPSRASSTRQNNKKAGNSINQFPYRGVRVYSRTDNCCDAAKRLRGQTFLAAHAPQLPLGGCDRAMECKCRYQHLTDRRQEMRRDADHGLPAHNYTAVDRRFRPDRRKAQRKTA